MIPVKLAPEPKRFDQDVRKKGRAWLKRNKNKKKLEPYWTTCLDDLHRSYQGVCAYLATHFERPTGAGSVDHFVAKSNKRSLAYEWSNYRLACRDVNGRKSNFADVLDPFEIELGWFNLVLVTGAIHPSPSLDESTRVLVQDTIDRLELDRPLLREMRARHFDELRKGVRLSKYSPFVWSEMKRQRVIKREDPESAERKRAARRSAAPLELTAEHGPAKSAGEAFGE